MKPKYILILIISFANFAAAADLDLASEPMPFAKNYVVLDLAQSFPVSFSQNRFDPDHAHPLLGYRHFLNADWFMGIGLGFKVFKRKTAVDNLNEQVAIWHLTHEAFRIFRLYHPTYAAMGLRLQYLNPTRSASLPLQRDVVLETEIGAAVSLMLMHETSLGRLASFRIDRWRGTDTMIFHGVEVAFGYHWALR